MTSLPRSTDDLRGLRAARWVRESTAGQTDRNGPDAQREQQDRAMERYGLTDTGITWSVAHSGRTIATTDQWAQMMAAAGHTYDVLVVGYVSRFARDLRTAVNARHDLHAAGAVILFSDERVLSSDPDRWDEWARETVEAESYSRKLARRVAEGYAAKFRRHGDQAGPAPLGFQRTGPDATLVIDPGTIGVPVSMFETYAVGLVSYDELGVAHGMEAGAVREILRNPIYNGWVRRHRRTAHEQRQPAPWRNDPPVSDALWSRVEAVKASRTRVGGRRRHTPTLLSGLLWCPCGEHIRSNGSRGEEPFVVHPSRECEQWGKRRTAPMGWYTDAVAAQVAGIRVDDITIAAVVAAVTRETPVPVTRPDTARRRKALDAVREDIGDAAYRSAVARLERAPVQPVEHLDPADVVARLRSLSGLWGRADEQERRGLARSIYARIEVRGRGFVGAHLTPDAIALGLDVALPSVVLVSREGDGLTSTKIRIPIVGSRRAASRRTA